MWVPPLPTYTPPSVVIISGTTATITVHNTVICELPKRDGTLSVTKVVNPDPLNIGSSKQFQMTVTCLPAPPAPPPYSLNFPGNTSTLPVPVPVGSHCTVSEGAMPPLPPGCHWLAPAYSPPSGVIIASGLNQETVTNGYRCEILSTCPQGTTLVDGKCVPPCPPPQILNADGVCVCPPPLVMNPATGKCGCPEGTVLEGKECVTIRKQCLPPQVMNPATGQCGCPEGTVLEGKECVSRNVRPIVKCSRGMVKIEGQCVPKERTNRRQIEQQPSGIPIGPGGFPGRGGPGGFPGGGGPGGGGMGGGGRR
jgi:uncharacterized membrane protein YgcG